CTEGNRRTKDEGIPKPESIRQIVSRSFSPFGIRHLSFCRGLTARAVRSAKVHPSAWCNGTGRGDGRAGPARTRFHLAPRRSLPRKVAGALRPDTDVHTPSAVLRAPRDRRSPRFGWRPRRRVAGRADGS